MKNAFEPIQILSDEKVNAQGFQHQSGLSHINLIDEQARYSAVFFIATPSIDDSGLAHAMEHLVFRRSKAFEHPASLFQLTSLLDVTINASTVNQITYFHCLTANKTCFEIAINYLIHGLLSPCFNELDLTLEVSNGNQLGVINRELLGYESITEYRNLVSLIRGYDSNQRSNYYGGFSDTIKQISYQRLKTFHRQYYCPQNISLITTNADINSVQNILHQALLTQQSAPAKSLDDEYVSVQDKLQYPQRKNALQKAYTWWLDKSYYDGIKAKHTALANAIKQAGAQLYLPEADFNAKHQFALSIVAEQGIVGKLQQVLIDFFTQVEIQPSRPKFSNNKYPKEINDIIDYYHQQQDKVQHSPLSSTFSQSLVEQVKQPTTVNDLALAPEELDTSKSTVESNRAMKGKLLVIPQLLEQLQALKKHEPLTTTSVFLLPKITEKKNELGLSSLPKIFHPLYNRLTAQSLVKQNINIGRQIKVGLEQQNFILIMPLEKEELVTAWLASYILGASTSFLSPRTSGHCYLIKSIYLDDVQQLIIYSAFDIQPNKRLDSVIAALNELSTEIEFLTQTLPLAKIKLHSIHSQKYRQYAQHSATSRKRLLNQLDKELSKISAKNLANFFKHLTLSITTATT